MKFFETLKTAAGKVMQVAGKAKNTFDYLSADAATRERMRRKAREEELLETNDKWISVLCRACGFQHRINSIYGGDTRVCDCGASFETPNYVDYMEAKKQKEKETQSKLQQQEQEPEEKFHDLQSAIYYFKKKSEEINQLPINEEERELFMMKLNEKRERVLEELL